MPRKLILIPRPQDRLLDTTRIEAGYPRQYTPEQMRDWAADMSRYDDMSPEGLARLRSLPGDQLSPEQQRILDVEHYYLEEPDRGIKGSLRSDGTVEINGGRHRAGYMIEQGVDRVPVWVSAASERELESFDAQCQRERQQVRAESPPHAEMRMEEDRGTRTER
jgi:hypothetical protein